MSVLMMAEISAPKKLVIKLQECPICEAPQEIGHCCGNCKEYCKCDEATRDFDSEFGKAGEGTVAFNELNF